MATHTHSVPLSLISKLVLETRFLVGKFQPPLGTLLLALQLLLFILPERGERERGEGGGVDGKGRVKRRIGRQEKGMGWQEVREGREEGMSKGNDAQAMGDPH